MKTVEVVGEQNACHKRSEVDFVNKEVLALQRQDVKARPYKNVNTIFIHPDLP